MHTWTVPAVAQPAARRDPASPEALVRVHPGVARSEITSAVNALRQVPEGDRRLLAKAGVRVELLPQARLEQNMIGATQIEQRGNSRWRPTTIRIAAHARVPSSPTGHIVVHEVGHAVEVLRRQDRTESAAERYVQRVLRGGADQALTASRLHAAFQADRRSAIAPRAKDNTGLVVFSAATAALIAAALLSL